MNAVHIISSVPYNEGLEYQDYLNFLKRRTKFNMLGTIVKSQKICWNAFKEILYE